MSNPVSITVSPEGKLSETDWQVTRADATQDFTLAGDAPAAGMEVDTSALNSLKNALSRARFEDVVSEQAAVGLADTTKARQVTIKTLDGFLYTLTITPKVAEGTQNYLLTVQVGAQFAQTRTKVEGESEEEATAADAKFAAELKTKQEKLDQERKLQGITYEVTNYTVQALVKSRTDLIKEKQAAQPARAPMSATSPPFQFGGQ